MYICSYYDYSTSVTDPVDCTIGVRDKRTARKHGHKVCRDKGYTGFQVLHKRNRKGEEPVLVEWHPDKTRCYHCIPDSGNTPDAATATGMYDRGY